MARKAGRGLRRQPVRKGAKPMRPKPSKEEVLKRRERPFLGEAIMLGALMIAQLAYFAHPFP